MYQFRALDNVGLEELAVCFNAAFSDYEQPIRFTAESMKYYLTASGVDLSLSFGAFCGRQLVGFILNSSGIYHEQRVVFDAGTGVVPEHRGKKVFSGLFEYTAQQLRQLGVEKYYLEVLQGNDHALSIYRKMGFSVKREYSVLVGSGPKNGGGSHVVTVPYEKFKPFATAVSVEPSFEHTTHQANQNPGLYEVLSIDNRAYCIYAKRNGEIIQIHYNQPDALKDVMSALVERYPRAMAKNVDFRYGDVLQLLTEIGFKEITKQFEMVRDV